MVKKVNGNEKKDPNESINKRLNVIIRLGLEIMYKEEKQYNKVSAQLLRSSGFTPTEIAKILGKKGGAESVSKYLYSSNTKRSKSKKKDVKNG